MMKCILDLPYSKCDSFRVKKIVETKLQQEDELGIDLSHMAPENRKVCLNALFGGKKRTFDSNRSQNSKANLNNPNNSSYRGNSKDKHKKTKKSKPSSR